MPFLLAVGAQDFPVLYAQAYTMTAALRDTEGACRASGDSRGRSFSD